MGQNASNATTTPTHWHTSDSDSAYWPDEFDSLLTHNLKLAETSKVAAPNYIYYRIYAEDGAFLSKTSASDDPFLGRIKARSVPPPHRDTAQAVKRSIAIVENIKDYTSTSLFFTPYSQSPLGNADQVTGLNHTGPGSSPRDPLAFVVRISDSERSVLESGVRGRLKSAAEPDTDSDIRYLYYLLYANDYEMPSKMAIDPEEPSLGRIQADFVTPPHSLATIKRCISRLEKTPELAHADIFADISCNAPLKGHISILPTDYLGRSPKNPIAIVLNPSLPDGRDVIQNRAEDIYCNARNNPLNFGPTTTEHAKNCDHMQVNEHSPFGSDSESASLDGSESSLTDTLVGTSKVATPDYIYYRMYAEDGAIPSKTPTFGDSFLGRIKARSVPPPHHDTVRAVRRAIARVENIKDCTSTSLFLTPYSQSPLGNADKVTSLNCTGPESTPREPLAFVVRISNSGRSAQEMGRLRSADSTRYLYYLLYANDCEIPSKVAIDPEEPSLGRIRADSITPPHSPATIKGYISRVEKTPALIHADLFADISCNTPLKEGHISILRTDYPGQSPKKPMAIVLDPTLPDGRYIIKNRAANVYWNARSNPLNAVYFGPTTTEHAKSCDHMQWDITRDTNGNISIKSLYTPSSWVSADMTGSTVPVPWRLYRVDSKFYYLTTNIKGWNPQVPAVHPCRMHLNAPGLMNTMKKGDQFQMWEFIPSRA